MALPELDPNQEEAQLALQGLAGIEEAGAEAPALLYDGPPEPDALLAHFGHAEFRPGQREAVEAGLAGRDSLIVMPTGGGKSLCYQLPGLAAEDLTIVVSPLIALMADQWQRLAAGGHPAVMIASGLGEQEARDGPRADLATGPRGSSTALPSGSARRPSSTPSPAAGST